VQQIACARRRAAECSLELGQSTVELRGDARAIVDARLQRRQRQVDRVEPPIVSTVGQHAVYAVDELGCHPGQNVLAARMKQSTCLSINVTVELPSAAINVTVKSCSATVREALHACEE